MAQTTFTLDKSKVFVTGLFWQPLSGTQSESRRETKSIAQEQGLDLAVWLTSPSLQVGLGSSNEGAQKGMFSAAAVISKTLEIESNARDFIVVTEVPGGWLYVAQRDGVILTDGDRIGSEDEIKTRLLRDLSLSDWSLVIAPDHWGVHGSVGERAFLDFLPRKDDKVIYKKWWALQPLDKFSGVLSGKNVLLTMVIVGVMFFGNAQYKQWQAKKAAAEAARIAAEQAASFDAQNQKIILEHPWKKQARAQETLQACMNAMGKVKTLWPGNWNPEEATCANGSFTVLWRRGEFGWVEHLRQVLPNVVVSSDASSASVTIPVEFKSLESDEPVPSESSRTLDMHIVAQKYRFVVEITPLETKVEKPPMPGQEQAAPPPPKDWREIKWSAKNSALPPSVVLTALDGNGFRVNQLQANFRNGIITWNMEGIQYVQP